MEKFSLWSSLSTYKYLANTHLWQYTKQLHLTTVPIVLLEETFNPSTHALKCTCFEYISYT